MAEAVVSFGVQKLWDLLSRESERLQGIDDQVNGLKRQLGRLQSLLKDANAKKHESERLRNFLQDVNDIVYDAEDIIESFLLKESRGKEKWIKKRARRNRSKFASDIEGITKRISEVIEGMQRLGIQQIIDPGPWPYLEEWQRNSGTDLNGSQARDVPNKLKATSSTNKSTGNSKSWCCTRMAFVIAINLLLEVVSAVADQLSSIRKPLFARISLVMSILSVVLSILDLTYKVRGHKARFRCKWPIPWFYYTSFGEDKILGSFTDTVLLFCVVGQFIVSTINYSFIERRRDGPIKVSVWPLFFAIGMVCSKFMEKPPTVSKDEFV